MEPTMAKIWSNFAILTETLNGKINGKPQKISNPILFSVFDDPGYELGPQKGLEAEPVSFI